MPVFLYRSHCLRYAGILCGLSIVMLWLVLIEASNKHHTVSGDVIDNALCSAQRRQLATPCTCEENSLAISNLQANLFWDRAGQVTNDFPEGVVNGLVRITFGQVMVICTIFVYLMLAGLTMMEVGTVHMKNASSVIFKNILIIFTSSIAFYVFGFALANGTPDNVNSWSSNFNGSKFFCLSNLSMSDPLMYRYTFQTAVGAVAAVIPSSCLTERTRTVAYVLITSVVTTLLYPICLYWTQSYGGWLSPYNDQFIAGNNILDTGQSAAVFAVGGSAGLAGIISVGARAGRFSSNNSINYRGHSIALESLGMMLFWCGMYAYNLGQWLVVATVVIPGYGFNADVSDVATLTSIMQVNTTLCACGAGFVVLVISKIMKGFFSVKDCLNGCMSGLVASAAVSSLVMQWSAILIGGCAGLCFLGLSRLFLKLHLDDPTDNVAACLGGSWVGVLGAGIWAQKQQVALVYNLTTVDGWGCFVGGPFAQVLVQLCGLVCCSTWAFVISFIFFQIVRRGPYFLPRFYERGATNGLRAPYQHEVQGLDFAIMGGSAYPDILKAEDRLAFFDVAKGDLMSLPHDRTSYVLKVEPHDSIITFIDTEGGGADYEYLLPNLIFLELDIVDQSLVCMIWQVQERIIEEFVWFKEPSERELFRALVLSVAMPGIVQPLPSIKPISVYVTTWNMGNTAPPSDSEQMNAWLKPHLNCDVIAIGVQEATWGDAKEESNQTAALIGAAMGGAANAAKYLQVVSECLGDDYILLEDDKLMQMRIHIFVLATLQLHVQNVRKGSLACGIANVVGNKGGVGISFRIYDTHLCFINCHLAAHQEKFKARNDDITRIMQNLRLGDIRYTLDTQFDCVWFMGDMNYRIDLPRPDVIDLIEKRDWAALLENDQFAREQKVGLLPGWNCRRHFFPPTYRYETGVYPREYSDEKGRIPAWCDRILWRSSPSIEVSCSEFSCVDEVTTSDHSPVYGIWTFDSLLPFIPKECALFGAGLDDVRPATLVLSNVAIHGLKPSDLNGLADTYIIFNGHFLVPPLNGSQYKTTISYATLTPSWKGAEVGIKSRSLYLSEIPSDILLKERDSTLAPLSIQRSAQSLTSGVSQSAHRHNDHGSNLLHVSVDAARSLKRYITEVKIGNIDIPVLRINSACASLPFLRTRSLHLTVKDHDYFSNDDDIGQASISLQQLDDDPGKPLFFLCEMLHGGRSAGLISGYISLVWGSAPNDEKDMGDMNATEESIDLDAVGGHVDSPDRNMTNNERIDTNNSSNGNSEERGNDNSGMLQKVKSFMKWTSPLLSKSVSNVQLVRTPSKRKQMLDESQMRNHDADEMDNSEPLSPLPNGDGHLLNPMDSLLLTHSPSKLHYRRRSLSIANQAKQIYDNFDSETKTKFRKDLLNQSGLDSETGNDINAPQSDDDADYSVVYIRKVPIGVPQSHLRRLFIHFGTILSIKQQGDRMAPGPGAVEFSTEAQAAIAVDTRLVLRGEVLDLALISRDVYLTDFEALSKDAASMGLLTVSDHDSFKDNMSVFLTSRSKPRRSSIDDIHSLSPVVDNQVPEDAKTRNFPTASVRKHLSWKAVKNAVVFGGHTKKSPTLLESLPEESLDTTEIIMQKEQPLSSLPIEILLRDDGVKEVLATLVRTEVLKLVSDLSSRLSIAETRISLLESKPIVAEQDVLGASFNQDFTQTGAIKEESSRVLRRSTTREGLSIFPLNEGKDASAKQRRGSDETSFFLSPSMSNMRANVHQADIIERNDSNMNLGAGVDEETSPSNFARVDISSVAVVADVPDIKAVDPPKHSMAQVEMDLEINESDENVKKLNKKKGKLWKNL